MPDHVEVTGRPEDELYDALRVRDIENVVVTGTLTEVCVAGTARDAATLTTIYRAFGDVRSTDDVLDLVAAGVLS